MRVAETNCLLRKEKRQPRRPFCTFGQESKGASQIHALREGGVKLVNSGRGQMGLIFKSVPTFW